MVLGLSRNIGIYFFIGESSLFLYFGVFRRRVLLGEERTRVSRWERFWFRRRRVFFVVRLYVSVFVDFGCRGLKRV